MNARHIGVEELADLPRGKLDACFKLGFRVVSRGLESTGETLRQLRLAEAGDSFDLSEVGHWHDARHERSGDAKTIAGIAEAEKVGVVVEELRDHDLAARSTLSLQVLQVGLGAESLLVGFRVARHENAEVGKLSADQLHKL